MKSVGVRELRQRASEYLRHVESGRAVEITARGRPVALLIPLRGTGHVERLVRRGRVIPPTADVLDPRVLPSLDALHLAAALVFGDELTALVTYDPRMATAAALVDLAVAAPR